MDWETHCNLSPRSANHSRHTHTGLVLAATHVQIKQSSHEGAPHSTDTALCQLPGRDVALPHLSGGPVELSGRRVPVGHLTRSPVLAQQSVQLPQSAVRQLVDVDLQLLLIASL